MSDYQYSYSRLATYMQCPHLYWLKYKLGLSDNETENERMRFGKLVHDFAQKLRYGENISVSDATQMLALDVASKVWSDAIDASQPFYCERQFECVVCDRLFTLRPDVIGYDKNGRRVVVDYKSGALSEWRCTLQGMLYIHGVRQVLGDCAYAVFVSPYQHKTVYASDNEIETVISAVIKTIESDETYKPNPDAHCVGCTHKQHCVYVNGHDAVKRFIDAKQAYENAKESLKKHIGDDGYIWVNGEAHLYKGGKIIRVEQ